MPDTKAEQADTAPNFGRYKLLSGMVDADIAKEGSSASTMVRAGLLRELLDDYASSRTPKQDMPSAGEDAYQAFRKIVEPELIEFRRLARSNKVGDVPLMTPVIKRLFASISPPTNTREKLLEEAQNLIAGPASWLDRWSQHVGNCQGGRVCSCGLTSARLEIEQALAKIDLALGSSNT